MKHKIQIYRAAVRRAGVLHVSDVQVGGSVGSARVLSEFLRDAPAERIAVIYLDGGNNVLGVECVSMGGASQCAITVPEVFRGAIAACAKAIILGHNHPSDDPLPSFEDLSMTQHIVRAGDLLGIPVLDHIVVTRSGKWTSILDRNPELFQ